MKMFILPRGHRFVHFGCCVAQLTIRADGGFTVVRAAETFVPKLMSSPNTCRMKFAKSTALTLQTTPEWSRWPIYDFCWKFYLSRRVSGDSDNLYRKIHKQKLAQRFMKIIKLFYFFYFNVSNENFMF